MNSEDIVIPALVGIQTASVLSCLPKKEPKKGTPRPASPAGSFVCMHKIGRDYAAFTRFSAFVSADC